MAGNSLLRQTPQTSFNWEEFWKKFAIGISITVGIVTLLGIIFSYVLSVSNQFGDLKDRIGKYH